MFKNIMLILLLTLGCAPTYISAEPITIETVKKSRGVGKWLGSIVPCLLSLLSAEVAIRSNKDNPDRKELVATAKFMRIFSAIFACFFLDDWIKTDFKDWSLSKSCINS